MKIGDIMLQINCFVFPDTPDAIVLTSERFLIFHGGGEERDSGTLRVNKIVRKREPKGMNGKLFYMKSASRVTREKALTESRMI